MLLHGWVEDRSWWIGSGYVDELKDGYRLVLLDLRGHGASDKPHDGDSYRVGLMARDVVAVANAEGVDRFAIWGLSRGGWVAWMTGAAAPERVAAIVTSGAWDPQPSPEMPETDDWAEAIRRGGMQGLLDRFRVEWGASFDREFPPWAQAVALRADPAAMLALRSPELWLDGISDEDLRSFPIPTLLFAGELEDEDDEAASTAAMIPNGERVRLPGLGHAGACGASALTVPTARAFLDRWFA
jgi:pimeloyl-ACP methyl ester carboxylesterase